MQDGEVAEHMLDAGGGHDRAGLAGLQPQLDQGRGHIEGLFTHLAPSQSAPFAAPIGLVGVRRLIAVLLRGAGERDRDGEALDLLADLVRI